MPYFISPHSLCNASPSLAASRPFTFWVCWPKPVEPMTHGHWYMYPELPGQLAFQTQLSSPLVSQLMPPLQERYFIPLGGGGGRHEVFGLLFGPNPNPKRGQRIGPTDTAGRDDMANLPPEHSTSTTASKSAINHTRKKQTFFRTLPMCAFELYAFSRCLILNCFFFGS